MLTVIAYQNASRAEKLRNEIAQEKRENQAFVQNAERNKMIQNIQRKRREKAGNTSELQQDSKIRRQFQQKSVVSEPARETSSSILNKVFD